MNKNHKYALQPLIFEVVNNNNIGVPVDGLKPDIVAREFLDNLGTLGEIDEPLLAKAIEDITGVVAPAAKSLNSLPVENYLGSENMDAVNYQRMYLNN